MAGAQYEIVVRGRLGRPMIRWFDELEVRSRRERVDDQQLRFGVPADRVTGCGEPVGGGRCAHDHHRAGRACGEPRTVLCQPYEP